MGRGSPSPVFANFEFRPYRFVLAAAGLFLISLVTILQDNRLTHPIMYSDEPGFVFTGKMLFPRFLEDLKKQDFSNAAWLEDGFNYGSKNPRIGIFIIGALAQFSDNHRLFGWTPGFQMRFCMAVLSAICVLLFFILVAMNTRSSFAGLFASALLLFNPAFRSIQVILMTEIPLLLFCLCALIAMSRFRTALSRHTIGWKSCLIFGLFAGTAVSIKLYAVCLYPVFFADILMNHRGDRRRLILPFFAAALIGFLIFLLSNPLLYSHFLFGIKEMTVNHVGYHSNNYFRLNLGFLKHFLVFPFFLFSREAFTLDKGLVFRFGAESSAGLLLFVAGVAATWKKREYLPLLWTAGAVAMTAYPILVIGEKWAVPKIFLLPSVGVIWTIAHLLAYAEDRIFSNRLSRHSQISKGTTSPCAMEERQ